MNTRSCTTRSATLLTKAILARDLDDCRQAVGEALLVSQRRKDRFFVGDKEGYSSLEDIFLAMEGLAMWVQYRTARERAPSGEEWLKTLITLSERHDAWSQEQGLGLFLLIDRLVPGWQARFLAPDFPSPFTVLREAVGRRTPLDRALSRPPKAIRDGRPNQIGQADLFVFGDRQEMPGCGHTRAR